MRLQDSRKYTKKDLCHNTKACKHKVSILIESNKYNHVCTWYGYCSKRESVRGTGHFGVD